MSRRESEAKRSSFSKIEREPSPKRSRRDGKPEKERTTSRSYDLDNVHANDQDPKLRRRSQDASTLDAIIEPESKVEPDNAKSELKKKTVEKENDDSKHSSDPTEIPRSQSYFQHDERNISGEGGRSFSRRATTERSRGTDTKDRARGVDTKDRVRGNDSKYRGWGNDKQDRGWRTDTKDRSSEKPGGTEMDVRNLRKRDERAEARGDDNNVWRHDRFKELEAADVPPPARKRPAFREKKIEEEFGDTVGTAAIESGRHGYVEQPVSENARKEEWRGRRPYESGRPQKSFTGDGAPPHRSETQRVGFSSRDRFGGGGSMGRDRFSGRYVERNNQNSNTTYTDKWKHDLYDEANKSPSPKNVEDPIAKVEALLAS